MTHVKAVANNSLDLITRRMQASAADFEQAQADFFKRCPSYPATDSLDDLRATEYQRLDKLQQVYLDYTGGGLYAASQLQQHMQLLMNGVYGNPHSANPTSLAMTELDESARNYVLEFFNASPDDYIVIFTPNASGALRLVGEAYPFDKDGQYLLTFDNHNSVNGIREFAYGKGAPVTYAPVAPPDLRIDEELLYKHLAEALPSGNNLFAYPAQSNFSGVQHSLEWIEIAHEKGWDVLLDAAAFAPTNRLDLARWKPDFVTLSFYKIFGYPTGVGALLARRDILPKLHRPWFAGGTITIASVQGSVHYLEQNEAAFEDGTIDYLNLPAVEIGLKHINNIGIETIHDRVTGLVGYLLEELTALKHDNGVPLVQFYGPTTAEARGGTIAMNMFDPNGHCFDYQMIEALANKVNISLRTGCFCNPGAGETALNITYEEIKDCLEGTEYITFDEFVKVMTAHTDHEAVGAIRVSVGLVTNYADLHHFLHFLRAFLNVAADDLAFAE